MEITSILTVVVTYALSSAVLFKYPTLIHKKKKLKFIAKHISHRGGMYNVTKKIFPFEGIFVFSIKYYYILGAGEYYENTLTAYERFVSLW